MKTIEARNIHSAVSQGLSYLLVDGIAETSRNGKVLVAPGPVCTVYQRPTERVLFGELRDANPFFHLMESLWMLAGRNDLAFPVFFNKRFAEYSDDGMFVHGAYGFRWRIWFDMDQLHHLYDELKANPNTRRAVLAMWSPAGDLIPIDGGERGPIGGLMSKDVPCNTHAYFDLRHNVLNMTVCCRSNDAIWGAYGANVVHFSILQEYMASWLGVPVGLYRQFSNNFHAYTDVYDEVKLAEIAKQSALSNHYMDSPLFAPKIKPYPLVSTSIEDWNEDLRNFMKRPHLDNNYKDPFFKEVAMPMFLAWQQRKDKLGTGLEFIEGVKAEDWKLAATQWVARGEGRH